MIPRLMAVTLLLVAGVSAQVPPIEPGISHELAKWRAAHYSDVRYNLNLTLEKMSPVLKGTIEIRVNVGTRTHSSATPADTGEIPPIILDWRKIKGHEERSTVSNVSLNGREVLSPAFSRQPPKGGTLNGEFNEHLIFSEGVVVGENVIKLDFTSPILASGSAITRYIDKEDGSEYIYSLFVPSDASTAFPVFDQPDLKAKFDLEITAPFAWEVVSNNVGLMSDESIESYKTDDEVILNMTRNKRVKFAETKPISTYVFAFAAGPWEKVSEPGAIATGFPVSGPKNPVAIAPGSDKTRPTSIYVRKSQAEKFRPHAAEVFRLNREAVKFFEEYFDYKFPFPKYDIVLIPEFPFGGMEHAGATFLKESSVIFPQEPTKNNEISRALLIFHEAAHQWFGDTVTMRWFDDLWLKEGFANFAAYKALEKIMPEANAWKVFYERVKQAAYRTDSTKGTTAIYQPIENLSAAKSAYGNIVYNKAPAFLRQAEFYIGEDKFQTAVRAFLKKHEFKNAGWEDLVKEFADIGWKRPTDCMPIEECQQIQKNGRLLMEHWARLWVSLPGIFKVRVDAGDDILPERHEPFGFDQTYVQDFFVTRESPVHLPIRFRYLARLINGGSQSGMAEIDFVGHSSQSIPPNRATNNRPLIFFFPNYQDYGYGIFLLDDKSREYVLKNIQNEKDPFLRAMMWGALWDSVREGELDPKEYVELVLKVLSPAFRRPPNAGPAKGGTLNDAGEDESTTALLLSRVGTAVNYYIDDKGGNLRRSKGVSTTENNTLPNGQVSASIEEMLIAGMQNSPTLGQRITYYRAFLDLASSDNARGVLKAMLKGGNRSEGVSSQANKNTLTTGRVSASALDIPLKTKDKFDIVTRLLILGDPEAEKLLTELEKAETSDDAKRYAYAARAGIATPENKAKYWKDFTENKDLSESWIEAAFGPWNSLRHSELTLPYLERSLKELPNHKANRKIFFVNGWLGAFIGGQRSEEALGIINKFLADDPKLDNDLRLKILENADTIERAVKIRAKF